MVAACLLMAASSAGAETVTILQTAEPPALDPSGDYLEHAENVGSQIMEPIVWLDSDMQPDPRLAVSWQNIEPLVWEIKLRTGVKFHNGEPFNAESVIASFNYMRREDSAQRARFSNWESMEAVDDETVRVHTKTEDPRFLSTLIQLVIMPQGVLASDPESLAQNPVGTGPFMLANWVPGERIELEKNPNYWRGEPKVDGIVFQTVPESSARVAALRAGQADLIVHVPPEQVEAIDSAPDTKILSAPSVRGITFFLDTRKAPFDDQRVRQAVNYAVDMDAINRGLFDDRALLANGSSHPSTFGHNADLAPYPYDPDRARELLAEAGYADGFEVDFWYPTGRWLKDVEVAEAVAAMLGEVGIRTNLRTAEYNTFLDDMFGARLEGMALIGILSQLDADRTVSLFLQSKGANTVWVDDPTLDEYFAKAQTLDLAERETVLHEMEEYIHDQAFWLFGYWQPDLYGANAKLQWTPPGNARLVLWDIDVAD
jgi:peptide/nickel transport system substrate-binding protein